MRKTGTLSAPLLAAVVTVAGCSVDVGSEPEAQRSYACRAESTIELVPVAPSIVRVGGSTPRPTAAAPVVASMSPNDGAWGTTLTIRGSGFGSRDDGAYVSIGAGAREMRVRSDACSSFGDDVIELEVPLGAEGDVAVHAQGHVVRAGAFLPMWRASAPYRGLAHGSRVIASLATQGATYVLVTGEDGLTLVAFVGDEVLAAPLPDAGASAPPTRAGFVQGEGGGVDLVIATNRARVVHVEGTQVEMDDACLPLESSALALGRGPDGPVAWASTRGGLARLAYARATHTWSVEDGPLRAAVSGEGAILADGSVAFVWGESAGSLFDDKGIVKLGLLSAGSNAVAETSLTPPLDDSVTAQIFSTSRGFTVAYCNDDVTGLFADTGPIGSHCWVEELAGGSWRPAPGFPGEMDEGLVFGLVRDSIVMLDRSSGLTYRPSPTTPPSTITEAIGTTGVLVPGSDEPVVAVSSGDTLVVARQRS